MDVYISYSLKLAVRCKHLLLMVFFIVSSLPIMAQTPQKITEESDLEDGHLYTVAYYDKKTKKCLICSSNTTKDSGLSFQYSKEDGDVTFNLLKRNPLLRVVKKEGKNYLYCVDEQKYLSSVVSESFILFNEEGTSFQREKVKFSSFSYDGWVIGGSKTLAFASSGVFSGYSKNSSNFKSGSYYPADLYSCDRIADYGDLQLSQEQDLSAMSGTDKTITFYRTFTDDVYNTLILPMDVPHYQNVFGFGVKAYAPKESSVKDVISFEAVADDATLKAGVPYILTGKFFSSPYIIPHATIETDGSAPHVTSVNSQVEIVGTYAKLSNLSGSGIYGCSRSGGVVHLSEGNTATLYPYSWYIKSSDANAKFYITGVVTTSVMPVHVAGQEQADGSLYNLQGVKVGEGAASAASLPHGVYIMNGKKIVK